MKRFALVACCLLFSHAPAWAQDATDASIRKLLEVTESRKLLDGMYGQLDGMMQSMSQQMLGDTQLTAEQQKILAETQSEIIAVFQAEMGWEKLEPMMVDVYRKNFTEAEVQGMLQFYGSEVGKSVTAKMPAVMQATMEQTQSRLAAILPKMQEIQKRSIERLKATCKGSDAPGCK